MNPKIAFQKAEELAYIQIAERAKVDLFFLCKYVLGYDIIEEFAHGPVCAATRSVLFWNDKEKARAYEFPSDYGRTEAQGLPTDDEKAAFYEELEKFIPGDPEDSYKVKDKMELSLHELMLLMPRGTLKSSVVTIGFSIQFMLNHPDARILLDSETWSKSSAFLAEIRGHFEQNVILRKIFIALYGTVPEAKKRSEKWSDSALVLGCRTKPRKEPSIDTSGVDVTKNGMHYDLIIFDDLHSEVNTQTKEQIEKVINHFKLAFSLLDPGCPTIVIGTRWTYADLYQYILDELAEEFNLITRAAKSIDGALLYPGRLTEAFLKAQEHKQGSYIYSCQYMNNPVDSETAKFKREYIQYKHWAEVDGIPINWYLTIDPGGDGESSDFAAFIISGMDYQSNLYLRHVVKVKMSNAQIVMRTFDLYRTFLPKYIVVETLASAGKSIEYTYKEKQKELSFWLPIRYIKGRNKSKSERIEALSPKYEFGHVFHIRECPQLKDFEDELLHYPKVKNDDAIDAFATVLEVATPPHHNAIQSEKQLARKARLKKLNAPRSPMVGY